MTITSAPAQAANVAPVADHHAPEIERAPIAAPMSKAEYEHIMADANVSQETKDRLDSGDIRTYADCPAELLTSLGEWAYGNPAKGIEGAVTIERGWYDLDTIYSWSGLKEVEPQLTQAKDKSGELVFNEDGTPTMVVDKDSVLFSHFAVSFGRGNKSETKRFVLSRQLDNRPLDFEKSKALAVTFAGNLWAANGEPFIFDSLGNGASCQHRTAAIKYAELKHGFAGPVPLVLLRNVPALFVNTIDTGRTRTTAHIFYRDPTVLVPETLRDLEGKEYAPNVISEKRKVLASDLSSVSLLLYYRLGGRDVNASIGSSLDPTATHTAKTRIAKAFDPLERVVQAVYNYDTGVDGKSSFGVYLSRHYIAGALCLYFASKQSDDPVDVESLEPGQFELDMERIDQFLQALASAKVSDDDLGHIYRGYVSKVKDQKPNNRERFAVACNLVSFFFDKGFVCKVKQSIQRDEDGKIVAVNPIPHSTAIVGGREKGVIPTYPNFGGPDLPAKLRGKAE